MVSSTFIGVLCVLVLISSPVTTLRVKTEAKSLFREAAKENTDMHDQAEIQDAQKNTEVLKTETKDETKDKEETETKNAVKQEEKEKTKE